MNSRFVQRDRKDGPPDDVRIHAIDSTSSKNKKMRQIKYGKSKVE